MSEIKINTSFFNKPLFKINDNDTVDLDKIQLDHYFDAINQAREKTLSYHNSLLHKQEKLNQDVKSINDNLKIINEEYNKLGLFKKLSKEGRTWKDLLKNETKVLNNTKTQVNNLNNELKNETIDFNKENTTINKLEKFFKSIPNSLISYNTKVQEKINKQNELNEYVELIDIIQMNIKESNNIDEKKQAIKDLITFQKDYKKIKNDIGLIDLNLKTLKQEAGQNLKAAKASLKQVDKELYRKIKQENYLKTTLTRINEIVVDQTINIFNNSMHLATQAAKNSIGILTKGLEKIKTFKSKNYEVNHSEKETDTIKSNNKNKEDLIR